ncbi:MAG: Uma2 family endonuclease [Polyangiaceae bacterium]
MTALPAELEELRPLRRSEYEQMIDQGLFDGERVELLDGFVVRMTPQKSPHSSVVQSLNLILVSTFAISGRASVRCQLPLALSDVSEPEPDFAVVPTGSYKDAQPSRAYFLVEVADSSLPKDRRKASLYARAGIPEYWLIELHESADRSVQRAGRAMSTRALHRTGADSSWRRSRFRSW